MQMKTCTDCKEEKLTTEFYFTGVVGRSPLRGQCKACVCVRQVKKRGGFVGTCVTCSASLPPGKHKYCAACDPMERKDGKRRPKLSPCRLCKMQRLKDEDRFERSDLCFSCRTLPANAPRRHTIMRYNMSPLDYQRLADYQNGACAVCGGTDTVNLSIDHAHTSPQVVRGLLCRPCNMALGLFKDDEARLKKALAYLANPPALDVFGERIVHESANKKSAKTSRMLQKRAQKAV